MKVYPNSAKDNVIFEIPANNHPMTPSLPDAQAGQRMNKEEITIKNIFGQEVATKQITSKKTVFDLRELKEGIYFYLAEMVGSTYSGKFIVQP